MFFLKLSLLIFVDIYVHPQYGSDEGVNFIRNDQVFYI